MRAGRRHGAGRVAALVTEAAAALTVPPRVRLVPGVGADGHGKEGEGGGGQEQPRAAQRLSRGRHLTAPGAAGAGASPAARLGASARRRAAPGRETGPASPAPRHRVGGRRRPAPGADSVPHLCSPQGAPGPASRGSRGRSPPARRWVSAQAPAPPHEDPRGPRAATAPLTAPRSGAAWGGSVARPGAMRVEPRPGWRERQLHGMSWGKGDRGSPAAAAVPSRPTHPPNAGAAARAGLAGGQRSVLPTPRPRGIKRFLKRG